VITTVHKAKGREWDNVLLADDFEGRSFSEDMLQRVKINGDPEARLLYVAITRAKRGLYGAYIEPLIKFLSRYSFDKPLPTDNQEISDLVEENEQEEGDQLTPAKEAKTEAIAPPNNTNKRRYTPRSKEAEQRRLE
ncbi:ATP-binding domain-containing protein, partial [Mycobacterium tuberculosis]|nr:ATP-binding domain-containing protein [Mycobacterium tuberculosis]